MAAPIEAKEFRLKAPVVDTESHSFEGYSAGIGNRDSVDDIIMPGAFSKTIQERVSQKRVKYIDQHNYLSTRNLWGHIMAARQDPIEKVEGQAKDVGKEEGATHLIWSKFYVTPVQDAIDALVKIGDGTLDGLSIGYKVLRVEYESQDEDTDDPLWDWLMGRGTRKIMELSWWETSSVIWGANSAALTIEDSVKELRGLAGKVLTKGKNNTLDELREVMVTVGPLVQQMRYRPDEMRALPNAARLIEFTKRFDHLVLNIERGKFADSTTRDKLVIVFDEFKRLYGDDEVKARTAFLNAATRVATKNEEGTDEVQEGQTDAVVPPAGADATDQQGTEGTPDTGTGAASTAEQDGAATTGTADEGTDNTGVADAGTADHSGNEGGTSEGADGSSGQDQPNDASDTEGTEALADHMASLELLELEITNS